MTWGCSGGGTGGGGADGADHEVDGDDVDDPSGTPGNSVSRPQAWEMITGSANAARDPAGLGSARADSMIEGRTMLTGTSPRDSSRAAPPRLGEGGASGPAERAGPRCRPLASRVATQRVRWCSASADSRCWRRRFLAGHLGEGSISGCLGPASVRARRAASTRPTARRRRTAVVDALLGAPPTRARYVAKVDTATRWGSRRGLAVSTMRTGPRRLTPDGGVEG